MLCHKQTKSAKHWDSFLSHCKSEPGVMKANSRKFPSFHSTCNHVIKERNCASTSISIHNLIIAWDITWIVFQSSVTAYFIIIQNSINKTWCIHLFGSRTPYLHAMLCCLVWPKGSYPSPLPEWLWCERDMWSPWCQEDPCLHHSFTSPTLWQPL